MQRLIPFLLLLLAVTPLVAQQDDTLRLVTYDSFAISEGVQAQFEEETGLTLEIVRLADAGTMLNQVILSKNNPLGDVIYGVDNTFLSRALNEDDLLISYESPLLENVPERYQLDGEFRMTPVTFGDVCINYDVAYFEENELPVPEGLEALTDPMYEGLLVVQNPAASSPGLAFLLATVESFGEDGDYTYLDYWRDLVANDVLVVEGWTEAYYGEFSGASAGDRPLVVSYASSPPAEVLFAEEDLDEAPTGAITATCFRQIEFAGILAGTEQVEAAQQLIDFMLGETFQEDLPLQMFVFPVNENAELPEVFTEFTDMPEDPITVDYESIEANREDWIEAWTQAVLD